MVDCSKTTRLLIAGLTVFASIVSGGALPAEAAGVAASAVPNPTEPGWTGYGTPVNLCACADAEVFEFPGGVVRLYYSVLGGGHPIRSKVSTDGGLTWVDEPGDRLTNAVFADVVKISSGKYRMYFQSQEPGEVGFGSALSTDGLTWVREPGIRLAPGGEQGDVKVIGGQSTTQLLDGTWLMAYIGSSGLMTGAGASIYWATSVDGLSFTKRGMALDGSPLAKYNVGYDGTELARWDDGTVKLYFRGEKGIERVVFTGKSFTTTPVLLVPNTTGPGFPDVPGDPTLARFGGRWHLFHGSGPKMSPTNKDEGIYEAGYSAPGKTRISCVRKGTTKAVTAVSPACPTGYALATRVACKKGRATKTFVVVGLKCPKGYKRA